MYLSLPEFRETKWEGVVFGHVLDGLLSPRFAAGRLYRGLSAITIGTCVHLCVQPGDLPVGGGLSPKHILLRNLY